MMALSSCVYLIEDDEPVARSLVVLLTICGYQIERFRTADLFLRRVFELPRGCVLMDITLPGMSGFSALDELRRRGVDWPVILMTGQDPSKMPRDPRDPRPSALLEKPFALEQLHAALKSAADTGPAQRSEHEATVR